MENGQDSSSDDSDIDGDDEDTGSSSSSEAGDRQAQLHLLQQTMDTAKLSLHHQDYQTAFTHYLMVVSIAPDLKPYVKDDFILAVKLWGDELESMGRGEEALHSYQQALQVYPDCEGVVNNMGAYLFRHGYTDEAASYFIQALQLDPGHRSARENLQSVCTALVERWHFRMLNDRARNTAFHQAIQRAVLGGHDTVLDIGTGTGILSMFAVQCGARTVHACEMSRTMHQLASNVLVANGMQNSVHLHHIKSTDMSIPEHLPERVSLVVTETVDAGLLGEHILSTLRHAWEHLLLPPKSAINQSESVRYGRVIPGGATVHACIVECPDIRRNHTVLQTSCCGVDMSGLDITSQTAIHTDTADQTSSDAEPYSSEVLNRVRGGFSCLTKPCQVFQIDFNDPQTFSPESLEHLRVFHLPVKHPGMVDAVVMWFDLHLDEETHLSTSPEQDTCWEQAIFPVHRHHLTGSDCLRSGLKVEEGDTVVVSATCGGDCIRMWVSEVQHHKDGRQLLCSSTENRQRERLEVSKEHRDAHEMEACSSAPVVPEPGQAEVVCLAQNDICALNDGGFNDAFYAALHEHFSRTIGSGSSNVVDLTGFCAGDSMETEGTQISNERTENSGKSVLDLSQGMSMVGLCAAKLGAGKVRYSGQNASSQKLLEMLARRNGIPEGVVEFGPSSLEPTGSSGALWDVVVTELVEPSGVLRQQVLEDMALARAYALKPGGTILPCAAAVYGVCVQSDVLLRENRVLGSEPTLGLKVADFMNIFQATTHQEITLSTLPHKPLTEPFHIFNFKLDEETSGDTLPSYLEQSRSLVVMATDSGTLSAVPFWFEIWVDSNNRLSTRDESSHWKQAAIVLDKSVPVERGQQIILEASCQNSTISITVKEQDS
ncbi:protein arginine N-methyltransferase 9-like [Branchiostoma floridae]|uniref:Protein arginine N-methyltransferase 9-like n=1 Tax=Branchiostoma floridae TaxID=7739 RepID=A0A9J7LG81_BRAFL|nr:protein arginine N-methyltransferase 9-like [Branchiostoma floridae]